jgi:site-specific recombinase XerD
VVWGDCLLGYGQASLVVQNGKGGKRREVFIPQELKAHLKAFLTWKKGQGEKASTDASVFTGQRGPLTRNGVWRVVKSLMAAVGLDPRYATHTCRHYSGSRTMPGGVAIAPCIACFRVARPA